MFTVWYRTLIANLIYDKCTGRTFIDEYIIYTNLFELYQGLKLTNVTTHNIRCRLLTAIDAEVWLDIATTASFNVATVLTVSHELSQDFKMNVN